MKEWVVSIGAVIILTSITSIILPNGKLNKFIKTIFSIIVVFTIIQPIFYSFNGDSSSYFESKDVNLNYQEDYLYYITYKKKESLCENCKIIAEKLNVIDAEIDILYYSDEKGGIVLDKVLVNLENSVINPNNENIDIISELTNNLSEYLQIEKSNVVIYGK